MFQLGLTHVVLEDVTHYVTPRIFNTNLQYSRASFTFKFDVKSIAMGRF